MKNYANIVTGLFAFVVFLFSIGCANSVTSIKSEVVGNAESSTDRAITLVIAGDIQLDGNPGDAAEWTFYMKQTDKTRIVWYTTGEETKFNVLVNGTKIGGRKSLGSGSGSRTIDLPQGAITLRMAVDSQDDNGGAITFNKVEITSDYASIDGAGSSSTSSVSSSASSTSSASSSVSSSSSSIHPTPVGDAYRPNGYGSKATGGGNTASITVSNEADFRRAIKGTNPKVVIVQGKIQLTSDVQIGSNTTLRGANSDSGIYGGTVELRDSNYIVYNLTFGPAKEDVFEVTGAKDVFITKCVFYDSTDELCSVVRGADYVTISWSKFFFNNPAKHSFAHLIGNSNSMTSDRGKLHVTLHHNWYGTGLNGRLPRVRFGHVHVYNNYYDCQGTEYCIGVGYESHIRVENCHFKSVDQIWKDMGGIDNGEIGWKGLLLDNSALPAFMDNKYPVFNLPYTFLLDPVDQVESLVKTGAGNVF